MNTKRKDSVTKNYRVRSNLPYITLLSPGSEEILQNFCSARTYCHCAHIQFHVRNDKTIKPTKMELKNFAH